MHTILCGVLQKGFSFRNRNNAFKSGIQFMVEEANAGIFGEQESFMSQIELNDALTQSLAEPTRRAILEQLRYGAKTVNEIVLATGRKQPNISNHLARMRNQGLLRTQRTGRQIYYSIATPYAEMLMRFHEATASPRQDQEALENTSSLDAWRSLYLGAITSGNEEQALTLVNTFLAHHIPLEQIYTEVFEWAMHEIGKGYEQGEISIAEEHLASAITERMIVRVGQFYMPMVKGSHRALIGCVAGNYHTLGIRMLADGLREYGWDILFLGANVPLDSFISTITQARPHLVLISCMLEEQWEETRRVLDRLATLLKETPEQKFLVLVGGLYLNEHPELLPTLPIGLFATDLTSLRLAVLEYFPEAQVSLLSEP
jgi:methanogenic corrinoid protein MtbC1/predicted transcriptional regulator